MRKVLTNIRKIGDAIILHEDTNAIYAERAKTEMLIPYLQAAVDAYMAAEIGDLKHTSVFNLISNPQMLIDIQRKELVKNVEPITIGGILIDRERLMKLAAPVAKHESYIRAAAEAREQLDAYGVPGDRYMVEGGKVIVDEPVFRATVTEKHQLACKSEDEIEIYGTLEAMKDAITKHQETCLKYGYQGFMRRDDIDLSKWLRVNDKVVTIAPDWLKRLRSWRNLNR